MTAPPFDDATFAERRRRVLDALGPHAALVLTAAPEILAGRDLELRYVVDPDLWYLTGYTEPEAVAVLGPGLEPPFTLFVRERDPERERWSGPRGGVEAARERYGADAVRPLSEIDDRLGTLLKPVDRLHFRLGSGRDAIQRRILELLVAGRAGRQRNGRGLAELADPGLLLDDMRLVKEEREVEAIREAVRVTIEGMRQGLAAVRDGAGEWEVEAAVESTFRRAGADGPAFATIAASGPNAIVLHYTDNRRRMRAGDLLLLDAGARHRIYNGDLTRTIPVGGRFAGAQRDVYDAVLAARAAALDAVRPDAPADAPHRAAVETLAAAMVDLGLLDGDPAELAREPETIRAFYPHKTSHWLGLDVHDVGTYARDDAPRRLRPGMVLTIEPGLYIPADADAPEALQGLGVRIEDDVLVTPAGAENLSAALPTSAEEVVRLAG